ncbi:MAG: 50S ribosomal protein L10 [Chlamydiota bacterium]
MRQEKQLLLDEIKEKIDASKAFIVTQYDSVTPNLSWEFRERLRKNDAEFEIVKKRIFQKAVQACGIEMVLEAKGNIGVVFINEELIDGTKAFCTFNKDQGDLFTILSAKYEQEIYSPSDVQALSKLPSKEQMRAQFIGLLEAPMAQTLSTIDALLTSVVHCLENKSQESNQT